MYISTKPGHGSSYYALIKAVLSLYIASMHARRRARGFQQASSREDLRIGSQLGVLRALPGALEMHIYVGLYVYILASHIIHRDMALPYAGAAHNAEFLC